MKYHLPKNLEHLIIKKNPQGDAFEVLNGVSDCNRHCEQWGRSTRERTCSVCGASFTYFIWSMSGGGKRCPECKVLHYPSGPQIELKYLTLEQLKVLEKLAEDNK